MTQVLIDLTETERPLAKSKNALAKGRPTYPRSSSCYNDEGIPAMVQKGLPGPGLGFVAEACRFHGSLVQYM